MKKLILICFLLFTLAFRSAHAQCNPHPLYFEDFIIYNGSDFDIDSNYNCLFDQTIFTHPDGEYWTGSTSYPNACGYPVSKWFGIISSATLPSISADAGTGNAVFIGMNVGSCLSGWRAPDQTNGWIPLSGKQVMLSAAYGRSSNMKSGSFIRFQYELDNNPGVLVNWNDSCSSFNLTGAFLPSTGTIFCTIPAGAFTGIRLYVSIINYDATTPEYHWFDNVKIEEFVSGTPNNTAFVNTSISFPLLSAVCTIGCPTTRMVFEQTLDYPTTVCNRIDCGSTMTVTVPVGYDLTSLTGITISATKINPPLGQNFSFSIANFTVAGNQSTFLVPVTILGGTQTDPSGALSVPQRIYDGTTFKIILDGVTIGNQPLPQYGSVSAGNHSGGLDSSSKYPVPLPSVYGLTKYCNAGLAPTIITQNFDTLFCKPASFYSYQWYFNGSPIPGATDSIYVPGPCGNYAVFAKDSSGCSGMYSITTCVGTDEIKNNSMISIFPNPAKDELWVEGSGLWVNEEINIELNNLLGENVYRTQLITLNSKLKTSIEVSRLSSGIYVLKASGKNGTAIRKIVIE